MLTLLKTSVRFVRARWRWTRGRCPSCNRDLGAMLTHRVSSSPDCLVCKDETEADLRVWHAYRRSGPAPAPAAPA